ncbi:MAG: tryptophan synthase subunit alpha [Candidatus Aenigmarchaeota archaeon]|nr:tryptophan synthase subunit alpha [Candidatus Aenigmarchaeota archaeon]
MTRIDDVFRKNDKSLVLYTCGGDPDLRTSIEIAGRMEKHADIIELGIPFSDPLADGPVIQKANNRALSSKIIIDDIFQMCSALKRPVAIMTYYNPVYKYGIEKFCRKASNSNVDGIIVVDMPPEEADFITDFLQGINLIFVVSRNCELERIRLITNTSSGFVYATSVFGTTGAREYLDPGLAGFSKKVKLVCDKPLALGFGISNPQQVADAFSYGFDAAVVGSALVGRIEQGLNDKYSMLDDIGEFCRSLRSLSL